MTPRKRAEIASVCAVAAIALLLLLFFSVRGPGLAAPPPTTVNTNLCCTSTVSTDTTTNTAVHGSTSSSTVSTDTTTNTAVHGSTSSSTSTSTTTSTSTASTSMTTTSATSTTSSSTTTATTPSTVYLTVKSNGSHFVDIWANGVRTSSGFTNVSLAATAGQTFTVGAFDNGCFRFSHWSDGSTQRFRVMSITVNTTLTVFYSNICLPLPMGYSNVSVATVDGSDAISGYYVTLWQNGALNQSCFSPCSFAVAPGTYQVSVDDFGGLFFNHWTDGSTARFHTVTVSGGSKINLTAVYGTTAPDSASGVLIASISGIIAIVLVRTLPCLPTMTKGSGLLWLRKE